MSLIPGSVSNRAPHPCPLGDPVGTSTQTSRGSEPAICGFDKGHQAHAHVVSASNSGPLRVVVDKPYRHNLFLGAISRLWRHHGCTLKHRSHCVLILVVTPSPASRATNRPNLADSTHARSLSTTPQCLQTAQRLRPRTASRRPAACLRPCRPCHQHLRAAMARLRTSPRRIARPPHSSSRVACPRRCRLSYPWSLRPHPMTTRWDRLNQHRLSGRLDHQRSRSGACT